MTASEKNIQRANTIKVGDICTVVGNKGRVEEVKHITKSNGKTATYIKVDFTGCYLENYGQYNHEWYGCLDEYFNY